MTRVRLALFCFALIAGLWLVAEAAFELLVHQGRLGRLGTATAYGSVEHLRRRQIAVVPAP